METSFEPSKLKLEEISESVLYTTDWTIETLARQIEKKRINLEPEFQRQDAWDDDRKCYLIESLILGFPVPQIMLAEKDSKFLIIDGKQRLLAIVQFLGLGDFKSFRLKNLEILTMLNGKSCDEIRNDPSVSHFIERLENQTLRTVVVRNWPNDEFLYQVFTRLNKGSLPLSPQELRAALFQGPFITFIRNLEIPKEFSKALFTTDEDVRFKDSELIVRGIGFSGLFPAQYKVDLKSFLDSICADLNKKNPEIYIEYFEKFLNSVKTTIEIFGSDNSYSRWKDDEKKYTKRVSKPVFDIFSCFFANDKISEKALSAKECIELKYRELWEDPDFLKATLYNTGLKSNVKIRIKKFGELLVACCGQEVSSEVAKYVD